MECKNCGEDIIKVVNKWYHSKSQKYFCSREYAEPNKTEKVN